MLQTISPAKARGIGTLTTYSHEAHQLSMPVVEHLDHPSWTVLVSESTSDSDSHTSIHEGSSEPEAATPPSWDMSSGSSAPIVLHAKQLAQAGTSIASLGVPVSSVNLHTLRYVAM